MPNRFYSKNTVATPGAVARPSDVEGELTRIETSFDTLQAEIDLYATLASPAFTGNPTVPTQTAGDNDTSIASTAFVQTAIAAALPSQTGNADLFLSTNGTSALWAAAGTRAKSVTVYTSGASNNWVKPAGALFVLVECWGAGGGGGGGGGTAGSFSVNRVGGGGGGGGGLTARFFKASDLPSSVTVAVGAGGGGGAGGQAAASFGSDGGNTTFGSFVTGFGGGRGGNGGQATASAVARGGGPFQSAFAVGVNEDYALPTNSTGTSEYGGGLGAAGTTAGGASAGRSSIIGGGGGGAGGSVDSAGTLRSDSSGGPSAYWGTVGGIGGSASLGAGSNGATGGLACGGGGGGASGASFTNGATGGAGGNGYCRITVW